MIGRGHKKVFLQIVGAIILSKICYLLLTKEIEYHFCKIK